MEKTIIECKCGISQSQPATQVESGRGVDYVAILFMEFLCYKVKSELIHLVFIFLIIFVIVTNKFMFSVI